MPSNETGPNIISFAAHRWPQLEDLTPELRQSMADHMQAMMDMTIANTKLQRLVVSEMHQGSLEIEKGKALFGLQDEMAHDLINIVNRYLEALDTI